jgi:hypothetical protein
MGTGPLFAARGRFRRCDETGVQVVVASRGCRGDNLWLGPSDRAIFSG